MTSTTDNPVPPENCTCASFWTVRHAHKKDCPLVDTDIEKQILDIMDNYHCIVTDELGRNCAKEIQQFITKEIKQAKIDILEELKLKATELHKTDLEMKEHHTGISWEDVIMLDEITKMQLNTLNKD